MEKKKIIVIAVALIAIIIVISGAAAALLAGGDSYADKVSLGYRYLQTGDYDNAILSFRMAIEEDGTREDAYYGLYQAYLYAGQNDLAMTALRLGVSSTRSSRLQQILTQSEGNQNTQDEPNVTQPQPSQSDDEDGKDVIPILNTELLTLFSSANYGDYCTQYGDTVGTYANGQYRRHLDRLGATLVYYDSSSVRVIDASRGVPYNQFAPNEIQLDNLSTLFGGATRIPYDTLKNMSGVTNASIDGTTIKFSYLNCEITIICETEGVVTSTAENHIVPTGEVVSQNKYKLNAAIKDATSGAPVSGAKVQAYVGHNLFGQAIEGMTDNAGNLVLELEESGTYTVVVSKDGYITENFEVFVYSNLSDVYATFNISPTISGDGIRFVLTWGQSPSDLDSYLSGTAGDGTNVSISYRNMVQMNSQNVMVAELDVDDTSSYGPETVTLYDTSGNYEFYVRDYTQSGTMSFSGAEVKIYIGSSLYTTVNIPSGLENYWHVCTVSDGVVTVTNRG